MAEAKVKIEKPTEEESSFVKDLGLDEPKPTIEEPKEEGKKEKAERIPEGQETDASREELDTRAEEVGLEAGASEEDVEAAELSIRAEDAGLEKDASLEDVEVAELSARAEAIGLEENASLEDIETAELSARAVEVGLEEGASLEEIEKAEKAGKKKEKVDLEKDLTQAEIDKLPKDAKGLYHEMKKEREKRKTAEAELQFLKLQNKYKPKETKPEEKLEEEIEDIDKILEGKADDDVLSVGELRRISNAQKKLAARKEKKASDAKTATDDKAKQMDEMEDAFKIDHLDYHAMLDIFAQAASEMPSLRYEIIAEMKREGGNPAKRAYEIGKKFKGVYEPKKKAEPSTPKKPNSAERIKKNAEKKKSSASIAGSSISNEALEEMEADELGKTLSAMSMKEFMKVPKKIRERAMR